MMKIMGILFFAFSCQMTWSLDIYKCNINELQKLKTTPCADYSKSKDHYESLPSIGMTIQQAQKTAWGEPLQIHQKKDEKGSFEQWVYKSKQHRTERSLNFRNGVLVAVNR